MPLLRSSCDFIFHMVNYINWFWMLNQPSLLEWILGHDVYTSYILFVKLWVIVCLVQSVLLMTIWLDNWDSAQPTWYTQSPPKRPVVALPGAKISEPHWQGPLLLKFVTLAVGAAALPLAPISPSGILPGVTLSPPRSVWQWLEHLWLSQLGWCYCHLHGRVQGCCLISQASCLKQRLASFKCQ